MHGTDVTCVRCHAVFSVSHGIARFVQALDDHPVPADSDAFIVACKNIGKRFPRLYRFFIAFFGISSGGVTPASFVRKFVPKGALMLNLGSGAQERYRDAVHVDLFPFTGVDVVADITRLPFRDASVDAAICIMTLEHVSDPAAVIREAHRVLKPGGHIYITTPFMYPYHSSPRDYARWTLDGLRQLLSKFDEVRSGLRHGSTSALMLFVAHWLAAVCSLGIRRLYGVFLVFWMAILAPLAHIPDMILNRLRVSEHMATGYYFIASKHD